MKTVGEGVTALPRVRREVLPNSLDRNFRAWSPEAMVRRREESVRNRVMGQATRGREKLRTSRKEWRAGPEGGGRFCNILKINNLTKTNLNEAKTWFGAGLLFSTRRNAWRKPPHLPVSEIGSLTKNKCMIPARSATPAATSSADWKDAVA